jgi:hypothetical protein
MNKTIYYLVIFFLGLTTKNSKAQSNFSYVDDFNIILERTKDTNDILAYQKLLTRYNNNDTSLTKFEVLSLLIGFTVNPEYDPYGSFAKVSELTELKSEKNYKTILDVGQNLLKTNPFSVVALFEVIEAYKNLNHYDSAEYFSVKLLKICKAMDFSGDGATKRTPIFELYPSDCIYFLNKFKEVKIVSRVINFIKDDYGNLLHKYKVKFKDGHKKKIIQYFSTSV